jgi:phage/plasmid-like protein (TIGR03299 family)
MDHPARGLETVPIPNYPLEKEESKLAHMVEQFDDMVSVREIPWHGLGTVLPDYVTVWDAAKTANLLWNVTMTPVQFTGTDGQIHQIPKKFVVRRDDVNLGIGLVSHRYLPLQNQDMWEFVDSFAQRSKAQVETAGSLENGARTWVLMKNGTLEYVNGDPIDQYFLIQNAFDANRSLRMLFTKVRVVCNNTLTLALSKAKSTFFVRHVANAKDRLNQVDKALGFQVKYEKDMSQVMNKLVRLKIKDGDRRNILDQIFPVKVGDDGKVIDAAERFRERMLVRILDLGERGAGTEIKGVRGTGYGLLQAVAEYADHEKLMIHSKDADTAENRFKSIMEGTSASMKQTAFNHLLKVVNG